MRAVDLRAFDSAPLYTLANCIYGHPQDKEKGPEDLLALAARCES